MDLQKLAGLVVILLGVLAVWLGFISIVFWILQRIVQFVYRWLSRQVWYAPLLAGTKNKIKTWWDRNKSHTENLWEYFQMVLIEPMFFGYAVFVLFNRLDYLTKYTNEHPDIKFWDLLNTDMSSNMIYFWFIAIFYLWVAGKAYFRSKDKIEMRAMMKVLTAIAKKMDISEKEYKLTIKNPKKSSDNINPVNPMNDGVKS